MLTYPRVTRIEGRYLFTGCPLVGDMGVVYLYHHFPEDLPRRP